MLTIVDTIWTSAINLYKIKCDCNNIFWVRVDKWNVRCSWCKDMNNLTEMRTRIELEKGN